MYPYAQCTFTYQQLEISSAEDKEARWYKYRNASETKSNHFCTMSVEKLVLRRTFALSVRRREGKLVLLEVQPKVRKIPAIVGYNDSNRVEIWTHSQFLFGEECSVSCLPQPESEDGKIKVLLSQEVDIDDLEEDEGSPERQNATMEEELEEGEIDDEDHPFHILFYCVLVCMLCYPELEYMASEKALYTGM
jgi:hypothetical protein